MSRPDSLSDRPERGGEGFLTHAAEAKLRAERDRYGEALEQIRDFNPRGPLRAPAHHMREIARSALEQERAE